MTGICRVPINCRKINYSIIDESFKPILKKIREKGFCTQSSCSGTAREHKGHKSWVVKQGGYMVFKVYMKKMVKRRVRNIMPLEDAIPFVEFCKKSAEQLKRIESAAEKSGMALYFFLEDDIPRTGYVSVHIVKKKCMDDDDLIRAWNSFAGAL